MSRFLANPYLLLTLTSLFWSGNMVVGRAIRSDVPPLTLAFWRWVIALACVLPFALPHLRTQWPLLRQHWKTVTALGLVGVGGYNTFAYIALQQTSATNALLLNSFIPIATIAIAWAFQGKRLHRLEALGVGLSLIGVITIVARGDLQVLRHLNLNTGDVWMIAAVVVWAAYTVGLVRRPAGVHPMLLMAAFIAVAVIALAPAYAWEVASGQRINLNTSSFLALSYVGILPSFVGYVFYNRGVAEVGPSLASLFIHLMPVFGILLSVVFLGEIPYGYHYLGIGLIFAGIGLTMKKA